MGKEYFCAYHSYLAAMEQLNNEERGRLFTALLSYSQTGEVPQLDGNERFVFPAMRDQMDRDSKKYQEKCEKNRKNIEQRYTTENDRIQSNTKPTKEKTKAKAKEKEKEKTKENIKGVPGGNPRADEPPQKAKRFTPPTVEDIGAYCRERRNGVDPQRFFDFYAAKGWMVGKNRMKDWKAAVRTWERRDGMTAAPGGAGGENEYAEIGYNSAHVF